MAPSVVEETTSLLADNGTERCEICRPDSHLSVDFDPNGDADNPLEWPTAFKWVIVAMLAFMAFTVTFTCISIIPAASRIVEDLGGSMGDKSASVLPVTIWELGEAAGPLLIAPLSEIFGRYPLINISNLLFLTAAVLTALAQSTSVFTVMRALTGLAVSSNVLNPAIVGDIFIPEQRGTAMSLMMFAPLAGGSIGPSVGGFVAARFGWLAVAWISVSLAAASVRKEKEHISITGAFREEQPVDEGLTGLRISIVRPFAVLFGSGVLAALSLFGSVIFAYFYMVDVTLPGILEERYGLSATAAGLAFLANGLGSFIGLVICNFTLDSIYIKLRTANGGIGLPEYRLPMAIIGGFTVPLVAMVYGWCAEYQLPLTLLLLSVGCIRTCLMLATLPLMTYVVDACGLYSASAFTGVIVIRCLGGAFLPIAMTMMTERLGYGLGFTALGAACICLGLVPVLVLRYGSHWRQRSKYTRI